MAQDLVGVDLQRRATAGLLLQLHHRLRHQVVHDLRDVHRQDRLRVRVDDIVDPLILRHRSLLACIPSRMLGTPGSPVNAAHGPTSIGSPSESSVPSALMRITCIA